MTDERILAFYAEHSPITDPGRYAYLFDSLPADVPGLARVVAGLLVHPSATALYGEPPTPADEGWGIRSVAGTLQRLLETEDAPLAAGRGPGKRARANCRNFAVLLVAMLRHRGVPARKRVGFAGYLPGPHPSIHEVAEYWSADEGRWVLVDPDSDDAVREAQRAYFASIGQPERADLDPLDVRPGEAFFLGGAVWRACRAGEANPNGFWDSTGTGMLGVRVALLQDLDSLNKAELLSVDEWHDLMHKAEAELKPEETAWLDRAAELTVRADERFGELREFYEAAAYARAVRARLTALGLANPTVPMGPT